MTQLLLDFKGEIGGNKQLYTSVRDMIQSGMAEQTPGKCLFDDERTLTLMDIIYQTTPSNATAVDLGAGSGILGFAFLNAGGKHVHFVEHNRDWCRFIECVAKHLGLSSRVTVYEANATTFKPPESVDYVIAELVDTGLTTEPLVESIKNIRKYTTPQSLFFPSHAVSAVTIYDMWNRRISEPVVYDYVQLCKLEKEDVDVTVEIPIIKRGVPYHPEISTKLLYPMGYSTERFDSLCVAYGVPIRDMDKPLLEDQKQIPFQLDGINLAERCKIFHPGQAIRVRIQYKYGESKLNISVKFVDAII